MAKQMSESERNSVKELIAAALIIPDTERKILLNLAHDFTLIHSMGYEVKKQRN